MGETTSQDGHLSPVSSPGPPRSVVDPVVTHSSKVESTAPIITPSSGVCSSAPLQQTGHRRDNSSEDADLSTMRDLSPLPGPIPLIPILPRPSTRPPSWRTQLNNFFMHNGGTARLKFTYDATGPSHQPTWHCTACSKSDVPLRGICLWLSLVDGIPRAVGYSGGKRLACENAAGKCYMELSPQISEVSEKKYM